MQGLPNSVREQVIQAMRERAAALEARLAKGMDYLDAHPEEEMGDGKAWRLWIGLLREYEQLMREIIAREKGA